MPAEWVRDIRATDDDMRIPPPGNRDWSVDECWAGLVAVHDETRIESERMGPAGVTFAAIADGVTEEHHRDIGFDLLRTHVPRLTVTDLPDLRLMMETVRWTMSRQVGAGGDVGAEIQPDGPFNTDRFCFRGVEVHFGRAACQRGLVLALWDTEKHRPRPARRLEDVLDDVYGKEHRTSDSAFCQLCTDTRRRFEAENCPLKIENLQGTVQLTPLHR